MISEAIDEDADSHFQEALEMYTNAVEFYLKIVSQKPIPYKKNSSKKYNLS